MAISSAGIGSGLDVQNIVKQLVAAESQPVQALQRKTSTLQTKLSVFGQIKSELSAVQDAASGLLDAGTWDSKKFSTNNASAVTGTATAAALASSFSLEVTNLASVQSLRTGALPSNYAAPATGTLSIQLGAWDANGNFSAAASSAVSINVTAGDSLATIAANINAQKSAAGLTATVITTGTTQQLLLRGNNTGEQAGFQITGSSGLESLGYTATPAVLDGQGAVVTPAVYNGMTKTQSATNASILIDGIAITSATNTVANAVPGVTLNLLAKTTAAAQITVDVDKDAIKTKIQAFQDTYNKLNTNLKAQTKYDAATKTGGPLQGDSTTVGLLTMMRSLLGATGPATSTIGRLSDLGLQIQADGSLKTNTAKLDAALQDPANVKAFFNASTGTASSNGIAKRVYDFVFGANAVGGAVSTHTAGFQKAIDQNNKSIDKFNSRIADYQKQLLAQYNRLDANMSTLNSLSTFVSAQLAQWNKAG